VEYRRLGRTGVEVSVFCLGGAQFGTVASPDESACIHMIHEALDGGINCIDTADVYGNGRSEEIIGKALGDRRDEVVLATKFHNAMGPGVNDRGNSRRWIFRAIEESLRRLGTDHVDLYQAHRPDPSVDLEEMVGALTDLVREGKVRYVGTSTFPGHMLVEAQWASERRGLERIATEQPPYSIFARHVELDVFPVAQRHGMGVLVWSPLAGGWLTGKYRRGEDVPEESRAATFLSVSPYFPARFDRTLPGNRAKLDRVEDLLVVAAEAGVSLTHMAMAFTLAHPAVTAAIIGPRTSEQLRHLLAGADVRLDQATLDAIDDVVPPGTILAEPDRGWTPSWMSPEARRRSGAVKRPRS
jgi:aryl-alcohol dehydrogenase-like predicted oxidoreductase